MKKTKLVAAATLLSSFSMTFGATLQLDIGNGVAFDGSNAALSPAGITGTYNQVSSDTDSGLLFSDGSAATGVTVDFGSGASNSNTFYDLVNGRVASNTDNSGDATDVLNSALGQDWVFTAGADNLGVRVSGLEAGVYDVYALVREPNQLGRTYDVGIGVGDTSDISTLTTSSIGVSDNNDAFVEGGNFVLQRVTITSTDDFLTVIVDPTNANFGTLGGLQIVSVPEPSSVALLGLGFVGFALRRRR